MKLTNHNLIGLRIRYLLLIDLLCITLAIIFSFVIRYEALISVWPYLRQNGFLFALVPLVRLPVYYAFRLYRRLWRYASTHEFKMIVLAGGAGSLLVYALNFGVLRLLGWPYCPSRSVIALEALLSTTFLGVTRFLLRMWQERMTPQDAAQLKALVQNPLQVLIVGAGDAGEIILREMQNNPGLGLQPIGFVDDNPDKLHMTIHGIPVLGRRESIPALARKYHIDQVIIAIPTAPGREIRAIKAICDASRIKYTTVPGIYELIDGTLRVNQIREVQIEDLLRREPVISRKESAIYLKGMSVMVTGAGGSIGSELCRQVAAKHPQRLILLDQAESAVYHIDLELRGRYPGLEICPVVADIRDLRRVERVMEAYRPEIIFHAAAYKHVPLMELNPEEVILNNIGGTQNLLLAAQRQDVTRFVLISTDKAVDPANFMGASKRVTELLVQEAARKNGNRYVAVRFGNVLGSEGSVVPLFKKQIAAGGPVTVTHPDMVRYFMTIPEAVQLVLQAANLGQGGEIFVLDMGEPVKIADLAHDMITLSGLRPGRDIEIVYTGLRPGEKLEEQLFNSFETYALTENEKIFVVTDAAPVDGQALRWGVQKLLRLAEEGAVDSLWEQVRALVPECQPSPDVQAGVEEGAEAWKATSRNAELRTVT